MGNLIRMELYRMRRARSFRVCVILAFVFSLAQTPVLWLLAHLGRMVSTDVPLFPASVSLSGILKDPFPMLNAMLAMLSVNSFFFADMENGYIKNIAGQMPKRGYSILSRYLAIIPHNLLFMVLGVAGNLLGTLPFARIVTDGKEMHFLLVFLIKFLLMQGLCSILLLVTASCRSKSLGSVLAVLLGTGILALLYTGISSGLNQLLGLKGFNLENYMPDQLLNSEDPGLLRSLLSAGITMAIFLPAAIRVFDRRDVK